MAHQWLFIAFTFIWVFITIAVIFAIIRIDFIAPSYDLGSKGSLSGSRRRSLISIDVWNKPTETGIRGKLFAIAPYHKLIKS